MSQDPYSPLHELHHFQQTPTPQQQQQADNQEYASTPQHLSIYSPQNIQRFSQYPGQMLPYRVCQEEHIVQPMASAESLIEDKNTLMIRISLIYLVQYFLQTIFHFSHVDNKDFKAYFFNQYTMEVTPLFYCILLLTIVFPLIVLKFKIFHSQVVSAIAVVLHTIIFYYFQQSLEARRQNCLICISTRNNPEIIERNLEFVTISNLMFFFHLEGTVQLFVLCFMISCQKNEFKFRYFYVISTILSLMWATLFSYDSELSQQLFGLGILFTFWFSFALKRVSDPKFGLLKEDQQFLGSLSVFIVMVCPFVSEI